MNRLRAMLVFGAVGIWLAIGWAQEPDGDQASADEPARSGPETQEPADDEGEEAVPDSVDDFFIPTQEVQPAQEVTFPVDI